MGVLTRETVRRIFEAKPEERVQLDRFHPLAQGLEIDWVGGRTDLGPDLLGNDFQVGGSVSPTVVSDEEGIVNNFADATSDYYDFGSRVWLSEDLPFTLAFRAKFVAEAYNQFLAITTDSTSEPLVINFGDGTDANYADVWVGSFSPNLANFRSGTSTAAAGEWHSVVITCRGAWSSTGNFRFYIDGQEITPAVGGAAVTLANVNFLGAQNTSTRNFNGRIAGFRVWPRRALNVRAAKEVSLNYWLPFNRALEGPKAKLRRGLVAGITTHTAAAIATGVAAVQRTILKTVAATATAVADRTLLILKTVTATATGVADVTTQTFGAVTTHTAAAVATGVAAVQKTVLKTIAATATGVAGVATQTITAITEVTVTAVATGVAAVQRTIFKNVVATATAAVNAVGSTGAIIEQAVAAIAQGIAARQVMVMKTVKGLRPHPVVANFEASFTSAGTTFNVTMPEDRPDGSHYVVCVVNDIGVFSTLTTPSEITEVVSRSQIDSKIWVGIRKGDDEPTFYTFTATAHQFSGKLPTWHGIVIRVDGIDEDNPFDETNHNASSSSLTQGVTPTVDNPLILAFNSGPGGVYTSSDPTKIYFGQTDGLISLAAVWENGAKDTPSGTVTFTSSVSGITFLGAAAAFPPGQGVIGPTARAILSVISQVFIKPNPFVGFAGVGLVKDVRARWARRRRIWGRRE